MLAVGFQYPWTKNGILGITEFDLKPLIIRRGGAGDKHGNGGMGHGGNGIQSGG